MIVGDLEPLGNGQIAVGIAVECIHADLRAAHGLHQCHFEVGRDGHDLARGLHLRAQRTACARKFVERPFRELDNDIIQRRLKAGAGLAGDLVFDFIQRVAQRDARSDLGDGIAGGLARQRRGTRYAGIDLDDCVFEAVRIERELAVAAADDAQCGDDVQRSAAQHLIFLIGKRKRGRDDDGVAGVYAHGVDVLH